MTRERDNKPHPTPELSGSLPGLPRIPGLNRRRWDRAARLAGPEPGWCCECAEGRETESWAEAAAPYILSEMEWKIWRTRPRIRAHRWIRGRVAAKDAVRLLLLERFRVAAPLETIAILPDSEGAPHPFCPAAPGQGAGVCLSITHAGNRSIALATLRSERCAGLGIDAACRKDNHDGLREGGFSREETALLDPLPKDAYRDRLLELWCAKEAAGKALGKGLSGNPLNFAIRGCARGGKTVRVEATVLPGRPCLDVRVGRDRERIVAVARLEATP